MTNEIKENLGESIQSQLVESSKLEWQPLIEEGINTNGIFVKVLRYDELTKRAPVFLIKI